MKPLETYVREYKTWNRIHFQYNYTLMLFSRLECTMYYMKFRNNVKCWKFNFYVQYYSREITLLETIIKRGWHLTKILSHSVIHSDWGHRLIHWSFRSEKESKTHKNDRIHVLVCLRKSIWNGSWEASEILFFWKFSIFFYDSWHPVVNWLNCSFLSI